jgi:hypothetical protein
MACITIVIFHNPCEAGSSIGGAFDVTKVSLGIPSRGLGLDDFNGDGKLDIINRGSDGNIYLLTNDGSNLFVSHVIGSIASNEGGDIGTADFNTDGMTDFALTDETDAIHIYINESNGNFSHLNISADRGMLSGIDCGDLNGDSKADIAIAGYNPPEVLVFYGNGDGTFLSGPHFNPGDSIMGGIVDNLGITVGDFNKDGYVDIITGQDDDAEPGAAWLFAGTSDGSYIYVGEAYDTNPIDENGGNLPGAGHPDAFDLDGDNNLEIITSPSSGPGYPPGLVLFFNGNGSGIYSSCDTITAFDSVLWGCSAPPIGFPSRGSFCVVGSRYNDTVLIITYDIIADWSMDESTGDSVHDYSGNDFNAMAINTSIASGIWGNCRTLNGVDAQIDCGSRPEFNLMAPFSIVGWVKVNNPADYPFLISNAGDYQGFWFRIGHDNNSDSGRFDFCLQGPGLCDGPQSQTAVHPGIWYHIAAVAKSNTELELYVNGRLEGQKTINPGYIATAIRNLKIGIDPNYYYQSPPLLNGSVDEVKLYAKALTSEEITALAARDTVYISHMSTCLMNGPKTNIIMPVRLNCLTPTVSMNIPLEWNNSYLYLDSVSFVRTPVENWAFKEAAIDNVDHNMVLGLLTTGDDFIQPGWDTTIAYLYFTINKDSDIPCYLDITFDTTFSADEEKSLLFADNSNPPIGFIPSLNFELSRIGTYIPGDVNNDGKRNLLDVSYIINYLYRHGVVPHCLDAGDVKGDCNINLLDISYFINYMYRFGPAPKCGCAESGNPVAGCCGNDFIADKVDYAATIASTYLNGKTIITVNSPIDIYGLELVMTSGQSSQVEIINKIQNMQIYSDQSGNEITMAMLDLHGIGIIPRGERVVLEVDGQVFIKSALSADESANAIAFSIANKDAFSSLPREFALDQNHPNPFNPVTMIGFSLPQACDVSLDIFNIAGQKVASLVNGMLEAGNHNIEWDSRGSDGQPLASGIYFYRLRAGEFIDTKKMMLLK